MITAEERAKMAQKPGLRVRIDMMCKSCIYDPLGEGNWRQQVGNCTVTTCPLYDVRPVSKPKTRPPS